MAVPIKVLALILPLSLDTFAVAAAMAVAGLTPRERLRLSLILTAFEAGMPVIGFGVGLSLGRAVGDVAEWIAIGVLAVTGGFLLRGDADALSAERLRRVRGVAVIALGLAVSVDELAIGLAAGLIGLSPLIMVVLIAAQAFLASQLGSGLGARIGAAAREGAERLAGAVLLLLALGLGVLRATGHGG